MLLCILIMYLLLSADTICNIHILMAAIVLFHFQKMALAASAGMMNPTDPPPAAPGASLTRGATITAVPPTAATLTEKPGTLT